VPRIPVGFEQIETIAPKPLSQINDLAWSPDGTILAMARSAADIALYKVGENTPEKLEYHPGYVLGVAWSPDGKHLATGVATGEVWVWDLTTLPRKAQHFQHKHARKEPAPTFYGVTWQPGVPWFAGAGRWCRRS
jgi:WD40 repeat protein